LIAQAQLSYLTNMAMARQRQELGQRGEAEALQFLEAQGYMLIAKNYRSPYGEIDLIVRDPCRPQMVVFVEVRTNSDPRFGDPLESISTRKQRQVAKTAQYYVVTRGLEQSEARFDVIGIRWDQGQARISHIPGAFEMPRSR
jgi:putative endonuclease